MPISPNSPESEPKRLDSSLPQSMDQADVESAVTTRTAPATTPRLTEILHLNLYNAPLTDSLKLRMLIAANIGSQSASQNQMSKNLE